MKCLATDKAIEMVTMPMNELPKSAQKYLKHMTDKVGMCIEVCLTVYAHYAQYMLGIECSDDLYKINEQGTLWFEENYPDKVESIKIIDGFKYSRESFDAYRLRLGLVITDTDKEEHQFDIYTSCTNLKRAKHDLLKTVTDRVDSLEIIYHATKDQDEMTAKFIEETLKDI